MRSFADELGLSAAAAPSLTSILLRQRLREGANLRFLSIDVKWSFEIFRRESCKSAQQSQGSEKSAPGVDFDRNLWLKAVLPPQGRAADLSLFAESKGGATHDCDLGVRSISPARRPALGERRFSSVRRA
jgi:hypothetical protein